MRTCCDVFLGFCSLFFISFDFISLSCIFMKRGDNYYETTCHIQNVTSTTTRNCSYTWQDAYPCLKTLVTYKHHNGSIIDGNLFRSVRDATHSNYECSVHGCENANSISDMESVLKFGKQMREDNKEIDCFYEANHTKFVYLNETNSAHCAMAFPVGIEDIIISVGLSFYGIYHDTQSILVVFAQLKCLIIITLVIFASFSMVAIWIIYHFPEIFLACGFIFVALCLFLTKNKVRTSFMCLITTWLILFGSLFATYQWAVEEIFTRSYFTERYYHTEAKCHVDKIENLGLTLTSQEPYRNYTCLQVSVSYEHLNKSVISARLFRTYHDAMETKYKCTADGPIFPFAESLEKKRNFTCFYDSRNPHFVYGSRSWYSILVWAWIILGPVTYFGYKCYYRVTSPGQVKSIP